MLDLHKVLNFFFNKENSSRLKVLFATLIVLVTSIYLAPLTSTMEVSKAQGKPPWAAEGAFLIYGWEMWEMVPSVNVNEVIPVRLLESICKEPVFRVDLVKADNEKGIFKFIPLRDKNIENKTFEEIFYWETGWEQGFDFEPIYRSPGELKNAELVKLNTSLGIFDAYYVVTSRTSKYGYEIIERQWFEKNTGVLLLYVRISNFSRSYDLSVTPLCSTNIDFTKSYQPDRLQLVYIGVGVVALAALLLLAKTIISNKLRK